MDSRALPIDDVGPDLLARWAELHDNHPEPVGPFLTPSYVTAVGRVRPDIEVGVITDAGTVVGFLPFQRLPFDVGGPVGGRLCDLSGTLVERGVECDPVDVAKAFDLRILRLPRTSAEDPVLGHRTGRTRGSPYLDLSQGFDTYRQASRDTGSRWTKQVGQRFRKLQREHGRVEFEWHTTDDAVLEELLAWKAAQRKATRTANVLALPWARALIDLLRTSSFPGIAPVLSSLRVDGAPAAAHFGIRTHRVLHYWVAGYSDRFSRYSPGLITLMEVARAAPERGIMRIDLGPGDERYKVRAASGFLELGRATVATGRGLGSVVSGVDAVRRWSGESSVGERVRGVGRRLTRAAYAVRSATARRTSSPPR